MNSSQTKVLCCTIAVIVLMGLFPPWIQSLNSERVHTERSAQYGFIFAPPDPESSYGGVRIDFPRLLIQWFIVVAAGIALFLLFRQKNSTTAIITNTQRVISPRSLNWRKGLFRLWCLASFIWVGAFAIATYEAYLDLEGLKHSMIEARQSVKNTDEQLSRNGGGKTDKSLLNNNSIEAIEEKMAVLRGYRNYDEYKEKEFLSACPERIARAESDLLFTSIITIVPPVVVFLLGMAVMWAFQGFSRKSSS